MARNHANDAEAGTEQLLLVRDNTSIVTYINGISACTVLVLS